MSNRTTAEGEVMREIASFDSGISPTAATIGDDRYKAGGSQKYRVVMRDSQTCEVDAVSGDEAATAALNRFPGGFVVSVNPAAR